MPTLTNFNYIPSYLPCVDIYSSMLHAEEINVNTNYFFTRHSQIKINRTTIGSKIGPVNLTIPIIKPSSKEESKIDKLIISTHGNWEHVHWGAIFSSYGKAPFFEHLAPLLEPFYINRSTDNFLLFCNSINRVVEDFIMLPHPLNKMKFTQSTHINSTYYQIWDFSKIGFLPSLSILDIAMHLGPEAYPHLLIHCC